MISEIKKQLEELDISYLGADEYIFTKRKDVILECIDLLDDLSAEIYTKIIVARMSFTEPEEKLLNREQYFSLPIFTRFYPKENFVDLGAYVGDSLEKFLFTKFGTFEHIYAFEPDKKNFTAMQKRTNRLLGEWALSSDKIILENAGVGEQSVSARTSKTLSSKSGVGTYLIEDNEGENKIYCLDDYFSDKRVSFIKADIESFELEMLKGAKNVLLRDHPILAISIYHNASDMFDILLYINKLKQGYKFAIRHHSASYYDTVLYAY